MNGIGISIVKDRYDPGFVVRYYTGSWDDFKRLDGDKGLLAALDRACPDRDSRAWWHYQILTLRDQLLSKLDNPHGAVVEVLHNATYGFHFLVGRAPSQEITVVGSIDEVIAAVPALEHSSIDYDPIELDVSVFVRVGNSTDGGFYEPNAPREGLRVGGAPKAGPSERSVFDDIIDLPDGVSIHELWRVAEIDPTKDLAFSDWSDVDFGEADLSGCNFEGANLSDSDFSRAKIDGMNYDGANITGAKWPAGYIPNPDGEGTWTM